MSAFKRAMSSSRVVRTAKRVAETSVVWAIVAPLTRWPRTSHWLSQTRERLAVGVRGDWSPAQEIRTVELVDALASNSRVVTALRSFARAPIAASRNGAFRDAAVRAWRVDRSLKVRVAGGALIVAVLSHSVLFFALGV